MKSMVDMVTAPFNFDRPLLRGQIEELETSLDKVIASVLDMNS